MKRHEIRLAVTVTAALVTLSSVAQTLAAPPVRQIEKADKLIGMVVADSRAQNVGRINELAVDLQAGRIGEVLVDTGGFLTSNHRVVAVPPELFTIDNSIGKLVLNADVQAFENAPAFDLSAWIESTRSANVNDVYQRFHVRPYPSVGYLGRAGKIRGLAVKNQEGEHLGDVEALAVILPGGQIPDVILSSSGFLGFNGQLTAIPPQAFILNSLADTLILPTTREALKNAPHFKASEWKTAVSGATSATGVTHSFDTHLVAYKDK